MSFATQDPGTYRLEIDEAVGTVGWHRYEEGSDSEAAGSAFSDGEPVDGDRWFRVYRGTYGIEIPERGVDTTIDAGGEYTVPPN